MISAIHRCFIAICLMCILTMSIQHPPIHAAPTITGISSSYSMACVVVSGSVWCFGNNASGRLGNGTKISSKNAVRVIRSDNKPLTQVTAVDTAGSRTCAVSQGQVWCWGSSFIYAQPDSTKAKQIITHTGKPLTNVTQISLGYGHACALSRGNVWCWGNNQMGQVGVGRYQQSDAGTHHRFRHPYQRYGHNHWLGAFMCGSK